MRLDRIKLAGFKSFVDPTTIPTPGNLIGIVGPNGCGKSNIIDAVRWVMGESSAKHLRGESMADVIFNGSSSRKPVGLASVELVFDNGEGKAPGEFAKFPEISIKRQVTRDGQSTYLLNGTRCRRKDITDLFLGTGLGSRSYAIIEQGTISRLIEAKPSELRDLIEEAAGISKYKERRHETELRMGHTQENLDRLLDLRDEVSKQLDSLKRQAKKAERFTALKDQEHLLKEQLLGLRWQKHQAEYQQLEVRREESNALFLQHAEQDFEKTEILADRREQQERLQKELNETQATFYELGSNISRITQTLRHAKETQANLDQEQQRLLEEQRQVAGDLSGDEETLEQIREELVELELALESAKENEILCSEQRVIADASLKESRTAFEALNNDISRSRGQIEIQAARIRQNEQQLRTHELRVEKLHSERAEIEHDRQSAGLEELEQLVAELEAERLLTHERQTLLLTTIETVRSDLKTARNELNEALAERHANEGRMASIETLQRHVMGKDRPELIAWLNKHQLESAPRLAELIEVSPEWENAIESVLGPHLQSLCLNDLSSLIETIGEIEGESIGFIEMTTHTDLPLKADSMAAHVRGSVNVGALLGHIRWANSTEEAFALRATLQPHEASISPDGTLVGPNWAIRQKIDDGHAGLIRRERELKDLKQQTQVLEETIQRAEGILEQRESELRDAEGEREHLQTEERRIAAELTRSRSELGALKARHEQTQKRFNQIMGDLSEIEAQLQEIREDIEESRLLKTDSEERLIELEKRLALLSGDRESMEAGLNQAEQALQASRNHAQTLKSRAEQLKSSEQITSRHIERLRGQLEQSQQRLESLKSRAVESTTIPEGSEEELEALTEQKALIEEALLRQRQKATALESEIRSASETKLENERQLQKIKDQLERVKLDLSANEVRRQTVEEQFEEIGSTPESATQNLPPEADEKRWQQQLQEISTEISRLGAVNLTAMEEYLVQEERMNFLDQQNADLEESLRTLREAIEKIDRECRTRFKDTFDLINSGLQRMFPKLFGGGQASLELTDRDLLETGVTVMARPPGKRNSSIHLLSGGEKALTAAALVFAIFELNPAPFCLLDEVDAPLDDANVGRFSQLVKEMSERVQFLFISHNKVTMEIAQHLAGVTMKEPGVSRIVAVDIDAAVEMTTA